MGIKMKSLVILALVSLSMSSLPVDVGEFVEFDMIGAGPRGFSDEGMEENYQAYMPLQTDQTLPASGEVDNRTHYHYDYQIHDHIHYVTLNYLEGVGRAGQWAGMLAQQPLNRQGKDLQQGAVEAFKFDLPVNATIVEVFHYHYAYTYHDHDHYIQAFDITTLPWWCVPPFFEEPKVDVQIQVNVTVEEGKAVESAEDVQVEVEADVADAEEDITTALFTMPKDPAEIRKQTQHVPDSHSEKASTGPYYRFATGEGVMNLETAVNSNRTVPTDNTTHVRYTNVQGFHTWYIPKDEKTTVSFKRNSTCVVLANTTLVEEANSSSEAIVVHYHVRNWLNVHNHQVYYIEDFFLPPPDAKPVSDPPMVVPGKKPLKPANNTKYMGKTLPERHPAGSVESYVYVEGEMKHEHKQELYRNGEIRSKESPREGKLTYSFYTPFNQASSVTRAHFWYGHVHHLHNHTVLLRSRSPPPYVQLIDNEFVSDFTGYQRNTISTINVAQLSQKKSFWSSGKVLICVLASLMFVAIGTMYIVSRRKRMQADLDQRLLQFSSFA